MKVKKCSRCYAKIIDPIDDSRHSCPWCGSSLAALNEGGSGVDELNNKMPERILDFTITRDEAVEKIKSIVDLGLSNKAKASLVERGPEPVYLPAIMADVTAHAVAEGKGENAMKEGDESHYDVEKYEIKREFDVEIRGLPVKPACGKLNKKTKISLNRIINNISPYDVENAKPFSTEAFGEAFVHYYDASIKATDADIKSRCEDIVRKRANESALPKYNCGICWEKQSVNVLESKQYSIYVPVWLFCYRGYYDELRFVAVNGRTGEVVGSVKRNEDKNNSSSVSDELKRAIIILVAMYAVPCTAMLLIRSFGGLFRAFGHIIVIFSLPAIYIAAAIYGRKSRKNADEKYRDKINAGDIDSDDDIEAESEVKGLLSTDKVVDKSRSVGIRDISGRNDWVIPSDEAKYLAYKEEYEAKMRAEREFARKKTRKAIIKALLIMTLLVIIQFFIMYNGAAFLPMQ